MRDASELEEADISRYVESQMKGDRQGVGVQLVQKVGRRRVGGRSHDLYDVWTDNAERWWVITDMTNLYLQEDFNSLEQAFTYHLGICMIMAERSRVEDDDGQREMPKSWRKFEKAHEAMADAEESEDFQAVGIRCREALLAFVRELYTSEWVRSPEDPPQLGNFKEWARIFASSLTSGRVCAYLNASADKTWDLCVWLQHYSDAAEWDAQLALDATANVFAAFSIALLKIRGGTKKRCPNCDSYRVTEEVDVEERSNGFGFVKFDACHSCEWTTDEVFEPWTAEYIERMRLYSEGEI